MKEDGPRRDLDRAESIFWTVRSLAQDQRDEALTRECRGDDSLRSLVASLLEADRLELGSFLPPAQVRLEGIETEPEPEILSGHFGNYELIGPLGRGGMGAVYEAHDLRLDRRVAIKLFPRDLERHGERLDRIEEEARLLARLNHPAIATVHSLESVDGRRFFTLELVPGQDLARRVVHSPLKTAEAMSCVAQIADALAYAHGKGVAHRDLKPENLKISADGRIKILDFGIGALLEDAARDESTIASPAGDGAELRFGTPGFSSAEQLRGEPPQAADDLWSLGCVLFYMLTGRSPLSESSIASFAQSTTDVALPLESLPPDVPEELRSVLERLLASDPVDRGSSHELALETTEWRLDVGRSLALSNGDTQGTGVLESRDGRFVGRTKEVSRLARLFRVPRLVTIVGLGGVGKSRLALEFVRRSRSRFPGGSWMVALADLPGESSADRTSEVRVLETIASEIAQPEPASMSVFDAVVERLSVPDCMVVLDNCEHLSRACRVVIDRLRARLPGVRILTTSRVPLAATDEQIVRLGPMSVPAAIDAGTLAPGGVEALAHFDSVRLVVDRLRNFHPNLGLTRENAAEIAGICRQVDGHPLCLELAAAKSRLLGLPEIRERLEDRLELLGADAGGGRRSPTAILDWSWEFLTPRERVLLSRLSVFRGSFDLATAASVCRDDDADRPNEAFDQEGPGGISGEAGVRPQETGPEADELRSVLEGLLDHSLIYRVPTALEGEPRFAVLDLVREFADSKLVRRERERLQTRHRDVFLELVREAQPELGSQKSAQWLRRLRAESGNLQRAIEWMRADPSEYESWLALVGALGNYWYLRGSCSEGVRECRAALHATRGAPATKNRWEALVWSAHLSGALGDLAGAREAYHDALQVARGIGDDASAALTLRSLAYVLHQTGEVRDALDAYEEAANLFRKLGHDVGLAGALSGIAGIELDRGEIDRAEPRFEEALELSRRAEYRAGEASLVGSLAGVAFRRRDYATALRRYRLRRELSLEIGDVRGASIARANIASTLHAGGDLDHAHREALEALSELRDLEDRQSATMGLFALASIEFDRQQAERAAVLLAAGESLRAEIGLELGPEELRERDDLIPQVIAALAPAHYRDCEALGRSMSLDRAVEYAHRG